MPPARTVTPGWAGSTESRPRRRFLGVPLRVVLAASDAEDDQPVAPSLADQSGCGGGRGGPRRRDVRDMAGIRGRVRDGLADRARLGGLSALQVGDSEHELHIA